MNTTNNTDCTTNTASHDLNNSSSNSLQDLNKYNISLGQNILNRFLLLNQNKDFTLEEIERISSVTYKFTSSDTQIKSTEFKERELLLKEEAHKLKFHKTPPSSKSFESAKELFESLRRTNKELFHANSNRINPNAPTPPFPHAMTSPLPNNFGTIPHNPIHLNNHTPSMPYTYPSTPPYDSKNINRTT